MNDLTYSYVLQPGTLSSRGTPLFYEFIIFNELNEDEPTLCGMVHWEDGLLIGHAEQLEPRDWIRIAEQINFVLRDVRERMGEDWKNEPLEGDVG